MYRLAVAHKMEQLQDRELRFVYVLQRLSTVDLGGKKPAFMFMDTIKELKTVTHKNRINIVVLSDWNCLSMHSVAICCCYWVICSVWIQPGGCVRTAVLQRDINEHNGAAAQWAQACVSHSVNISAAGWLISLNCLKKVRTQHLQPASYPHQIIERPRKKPWRRSGEVWRHAIWFHQCEPAGDLFVTGNSA